MKTNFQSLHPEYFPVDVEEKFKMLRHFPELARSINQTKEDFENGNNFKKTKTSSKGLSSSKSKETTNSKLNELCKTSIDDANTLNQVRTRIVEERQIRRQESQRYYSPRSNSNISPRSQNKQSFNSDRITVENPEANQEAIRSTDYLAAANRKFAMYGMTVNKSLLAVLTGYNEASLTKQELCEHLYACLNIILSPEELDVVYKELYL